MEVTDKLRSLTAEQIQTSKIERMLAQQTKAVVIGAMGWQFNAEGYKRADAALRAAKAAYKKEEPVPREYDPAGPVLLSYAQSTQSWEALRKQLDRDITKLAPELPCADVLDVPGVGGKAVGKLVGICGPLHNFSSVGRFFRYTGVAPRAAPGNFNREARAVLHTLATACKTMNGGVTARSPYRDVYDMERERMAAKAVKVKGDDGKLRWSPCSPDAHAMKMVAREIARDTYHAWYGEPLTLGRTRLS
jgi:hypothetical protein